MMAIGYARLEARAHSRLQQVFARVIDQGNLALYNENEFIFMLMPVAMGGPGARSQGCQVHAILREAKEVPKGPLFPALNGACKLRRVNCRSSGRN